MKIANYLSTISYARHLFIKNIGSPIYLIFFITEQCNARCKHCFGSFAKERVENELTLEEIEKISKNMGNLLYLLPTGGEPFLREDFPEIINIFYQNNGLRNVGIPTNGSLTKRVVASVNRMLSLCPDLRLGVDISLDELGQAHDDLRGFPGLFDKAIETYWALKEVEKKNQNFKICVEMTVSHFNQDHVFEIYDYFINKLKAYNVFVRIVRGNPREPEAKEVDIEKFERFVMKLEEDIRNKVFYGHAVYPLSEFITVRDIIGRRLTLKTLKDNKFQIPCYAGSLTGILRSRGDVFPCELLNQSFGNLREVNYNFKQLWQSETAKKIRRMIKESKCFCSHECFITNNILFNPRMLPEVLKEYIRLKLR